MKFVLVLSLFISQLIYAQDDDIKIIDSLYREDQFYFGFTYNTLVGKSSNLTSNTIALGFSLGFLRDFPINKARTWAIAPGLGIGSNFENSIKTSQDYIIDSQTQNYNSSKFSYFNFDLPIEIRWRNSSPTKRDFLRIYSGFKLSYLYFLSTENINTNDLNNIQYSPYLSIGYGTWNFYFHYALSPVFKNDFIQYESNGNFQNYELSKIRNIHAGLIFYIL